MKNSFFAIFSVMVMSLFLIIPMQSSAQESCPSGFKTVAGICVPEAKGTGYAGQTDFSKLLVKIITTLLQISGGIAVLFVIYGGFMYMTSGGSEEQAKKGRTTLLYALGGIVIIALAYGIVSLVVKTVS